MTREVCTLDLGNSALKLRRWELEGARRPRLASANTLELAAASFEPDLLAWLAQGRGGEVALSSVAAADVEQRVLRACRDAGREACTTLAPGVENCTRTPLTVGCDRLFAARGAWELVGASCVVIDAGTAVTVDALEAAARPRFLGGAIAPGPALMSRALHQFTARLPLVEVDSSVPALGVDTVSALQAGVLHGFRGAVLELARRMSTELGGVVPIVISGGAAPLLLEPRLLEGEVQHEPELVHLGLLAALLDAGSAPRRHGWQR